MLTIAQQKRLNFHVAVEANTSRFYLSASCWAESQGLTGVASFYRQHHEQEEEHMHKLMDYILETGGRVLVDTVEKPPQEFESILSLLNLSLEK